MIDSRIRVEYLSPERWGRLGEVIERFHPPKRILYARTDGGGTAWDCDGGSVSLPLYGDGTPDGNALLRLHPEYDELQLWTAEQAEEWYVRVNRSCCSNTGIEAFLQTLRNLPCGRFTRGVQSKGNAVWEAFLRPPAKDEARLALIFRDGRLYFDALLIWQSGAVTMLTSLDRYPEEPCAASAHTLDRICGMINREFGLPVRVDKMDWDTLR